MSITVIERVFEHSAAQGTTLAVLLKLASHADDKSYEAWPGKDSIAAAVNVTPRNVANALRALEATGEIEVVKRGGGGPKDTSCYRVVVGLATEAPKGVAGDMDVAADMDVADGRLRVSLATDKGVAGDTRTVKEPSEEPSRESTPDEVRAIFDFWRDATGKSSTTRLTPERTSKIKARLKTYPAEEIKLAIANVAASEFHRRGGHNDLTLICRSDTQLEGYRDMPVEQRNRHDNGSRGGGVTMADRERAVRSLSIGSEERTARSVLLSHVCTILHPPPPGDIDPFTQMPLETPEEARAALAALVPDVDAAIAEHTDEAEAVHRHVTMQNVRRRVG